MNGVPTPSQRCARGAPGPKHHYHFQVLALDRMIDTPAGATRDQVLAAVKGHVVAKGELVGTFQAPKS